MKQTFGDKILAGGSLALGLASDARVWLSRKLTALGLPKALVSILTWGVLLSLGAVLLGIIAFGVFLMVASRTEKKRKVILGADDYESLQSQARAEGQLGEWVHLSAIEAEEVEDRSSSSWPN